MQGFKTINLQETFMIYLLSNNNLFLLYPLEMSSQMI